MSLAQRCAGAAIARALIVVAKQPAVGRTKTRLCPPLSGGQAAQLYECFLRDVLELAARVDGVQPVVAYLPDEGRDYFVNLAPNGFEFTPQQGADLGRRLDNVLRHCLSNGYRQAVVMSSDSPTLPLDYLRRAFQALDDPDTDVVLGPCEDGGYYLIGVKTPNSALFDGIEMSTSTVGEETLRRAARAGLNAVCLPEWYDVDLPSELARLVDVLLRDNQPATAHHTREFLAEAAANWMLPGCSVPS